MRRSSIWDPSLFAVGGRYEPIADNFSDLAHFFKCDSASAAMADSIGTLVVNDGSLTANTANADGTLTLGASKNAIASGAWTSPGTKNVLVISIGKPVGTSSNLVFGAVGSSSERGFSVRQGSTNTPQVVGDSAGAVITGPANIIGDGEVLQARAVAITWASATGIDVFDYDGTTFNDRAASGDLSLHTGIVTMDAAVVFQSGSNPALIQVWHFTTLPPAAEIKAALTWTRSMIANSPSGTPMKVAYPGWKS